MEQEWGSVVVVDGACVDVVLLRAQSTHLFFQLFKFVFSFTFDWRICFWVVVCVWGRG